MADHTDQASEKLQQRPELQTDVSSDAAKNRRPQNFGNSRAVGETDDATHQSDGVQPPIHKRKEA